MLIDESTLRPGLYRLPDEPVGPKILIPGFRSATSVRGAFGWFSAGWIGQLAPGLVAYLERSDTAPIEFTVSPTFFPAELAAASEAVAMSEDEASRRIAQVFVDGRIDATALARHALDCLAWMIAAGRLRLRIAVPTIDSNYHPKIWLFDDGRDHVLARGSGNATGRGISAGVEHMDVDVTWIDHSRSRVRDGITILDDWSRGRSYGLAGVFELPEAIEQEIVHSAPEERPDMSDYEKARYADGEPAWASSPSESLLARFGRARATARSASPSALLIPEHLRWDDGRYSHQGEAVKAWENAEPAERGTVAMATGAGKTLTALIIATRVQDRLNAQPFLVVVSAPSLPLIHQWVTEIAKFGVNAVAPSLSSNGTDALTGVFRQLESGGTQVVVVTNHMLSSPSFQQTVVARRANARLPFATMLIGDEAHTLGAEGFTSHLPEFFERRLALSATPERQYDRDGTESIFRFFGPTVYEFGLSRAIGFCLVPYDYYVHAATLDGDELDEYGELTARLGAAIGREDDEAIRRLAIARRRIIETAAAKPALLRRVLERRQPRTLTHALIYASAKNPEQFDAIGKLLTELDVRWAPVTQDTTGNARLLRETFDTFREGGYQVLLAKRVLDEGVDIPSIREAFVVASSTVQREWIQRRGRVLRMHENKPFALLHDFLALPPPGSVAPGDTGGRKIILSELDRAYSFAAHARNAGGAHSVLSDLDAIREAYWPSGASTVALSKAGESYVAAGTPEGRPW